MSEDIVVPGLWVRYCIVNGLMKYLNIDGSHSTDPRKAWLSEKTFASTGFEWISTDAINHNHKLANSRNRC